MEVILDVQYCLEVVHGGVWIYLHLNELSVSFHTALIYLDCYRFLFLLGFREPYSHYALIFPSHTACHLQSVLPDRYI